MEHPTLSNYWPTQGCPGVELACANLPNQPSHAMPKSEETLPRGKLSKMSMQSSPGSIHDNPASKEVSQGHFLRYFRPCLAILIKTGAK
eukprot:scaffold265134_cov17-Tisochrysis_lutea.AAC.3